MLYSKFVIVMSMWHCVSLLNMQTLNNKQPISQKK